MLECYNNYIGIKGYCRDSDDTPPYSGKYINDLAGFTSEFLNDAANLEHIETDVELFEASFRNALSIVQEDFISAIESRFRVRTSGIRETKKVGWYETLDDDKFHAFENIRRGVILQNRIRKDQKLTRIKITEISLWAKPNIDTFVYIIDGNNTYSIPITTDRYEPVTLKVDHFMETDQVFIVTDNSILETYKSGSYPTSNRHYFNSCLSECCSGRANDLYMFGWDGNSIDFDTYGISVKALMYCHYDDFWCALKDLLVLPLLYKTGVLLLEEAFYGTRNNFVRGLSGEKEYMEKLNNDYRRALDTAVMKSEYLVKHIDKYCMPCKGAISTLMGV